MPIKAGRWDALSRSGILVEAINMIITSQSRSLNIQSTRLVIFWIFSALFWIFSSLILIFYFWQQIEFFWTKLSFSAEHISQRTPMIKKLFKNLQENFIDTLIRSPYRKKYNINIILSSIEILYLATIDRVEVNYKNNCNT